VPESVAPPPVTAWVARESLRRRAGAEPHGLTVGRGAQRLTFAMHALDGDGGSGEWLLVLRQDSEAALLDGLLRAFPLTAREAEVLYWVIQGKTNRDIGEILTLSPRTVHKHLEHVFEKLGVETRTAAAALALQRIG
jgi:DNA-binding CsgD family transcriptional regulator